MTNVIWIYDAFEYNLMFNHEFPKHLTEDFGLGSGQTIVCSAQNDMIIKLARTFSGATGRKGLIKRTSAMLL